MIELHDATAVVRAVVNTDAYAYWAPGDATVYRVAYVRAQRYGLDALDGSEDLVFVLVMVGRYGVDRHLLLARPRADHDAWTPKSFVRAFGDAYAGWWAGVRPLLAALGWTALDDRDVAYRAEDAVDVATQLKLFAHS